MSYIEQVEHEQNFCNYLYLILPYKVYLIPKEIKKKYNK